MKCRIILYIDTHHGVRNILYGHSQWSEGFLMDTLSGVKISNGHSQWSADYFYNDTLSGVPFSSI